MAGYVHQTEREREKAAAIQRREQQLRTENRRLTSLNADLRTELWELKTRDAPRPVAPIRVSPIEAARNQTILASEINAFDEARSAKGAASRQWMRRKVA